MSYAKLREYLDSLDLSFEQTHRSNCPVCNSTNTFTATMTSDGLVYNCYSAHCSVSGAVDVPLSVQAIRTSLSRNTVKLPSQDVAPKEMLIPEHCVKGSSNFSYRQMLRRYKLEEDKLDLYHDIRSHRLCFPIKHKGRVVDMVGRSLSGAPPKWMRYNDEHYPYVTGVGPTAVVVEDAISASVVAHSVEYEYTGVALLGTKLLDTHRDVLSKYPQVVVALDPDARSTGLTIVKELRSVCKRVMMLSTQDDLKYALPEDLESLRKISTQS